MGCTLSSSVHKQTRVGFKLTASSKGDSNSLPVSRRKQMPLNERQRFLLLKSWKCISRDIKETGINMFARMFENNKEIFSYFKWVSNTSSVAAVRQNKSLVAHAQMVMRVLDDAISSFGDADSITDLLLTIGASHHQILNFNANLFSKIEEPFLMAVKDSLGERYTVNIEYIYSQAIRFILTTLQEGYTVSQ